MKSRQFVSALFVLSMCCIILVGGIRAILL